MFKNIYVELIFGGTLPEEPDQDSITGDNDIFSAEAATFTYFIDRERN